MLTMEQILDETAAYYGRDPRRRATVDPPQPSSFLRDTPYADPCTYFSKETGNRCAVGRCLRYSVLLDLMDATGALSSLIDEDELEERVPTPDFWELKNDTFRKQWDDARERARSELLDELLFPRYRGHPFLFWRRLQFFHDRQDHWDLDDGGLTEEGREYVERMRNYEIPKFRAMVQQWEKQRQREKPPVVTMEFLEYLDACPSDKRLFDSLFGNSVEVTEDNVLKAVTAGLDLSWFASAVFDIVQHDNSFLLRDLGSPWSDYRDHSRAHRAARAAWARHLDDNYPQPPQRWMRTSCSPAYLDAKSTILYAPQATASYQFLARWLREAIAIVDHRGDDG